VEIRKAEIKDYEAYCSLVRQVDEIHAAGAPRYFRVPEPPRSQDFYLKRLGEPLRALFVAEKGANMVAYIDLRELESAPVPLRQPVKIVEVCDLVVGKTERRLGIGTALLEKGKAWARERGADEFQLSVWDFNQGALKMYEQSGFEPKYRTLALRLQP
jgi:ribosomal protein S18 acetylase RimI-like enzyme